MPVKICHILFLLFAASAWAVEVSVGLQTSSFPDTEFSTNVIINASGELLKNIDAVVHFNPSLSNNVGTQ